MYYKIENQESKLYQELRKMMEHEQQLEKDNRKAVEEKVGLSWDKFLGNTRQQGFGRTTSYNGFLFHQPKKVDPKIWKEHKEHKGLFVPNRRTKKGNEMHKFLNNGLPTGSLFKLMDTLKIETCGRFQTPFCDLVQDTIILFLDNSHIPQDKNAIEITSKEFDEIRLSESVTNS